MNKNIEPRLSPTAEQVISVAMRLAARTLGHVVSGSPRADDLARYVLRHGAAVGATAEVKDAPSEEQIANQAQVLAAEIHEAWEFQYDQCDHGTYRGGHLNGEPYAMCEITAERIVRRRAAADVAPQENPKCEHGIALSDLCQFADHVANAPQESSEEPAPSTDREKLIAEARDALKRINVRAFPHDLAFQYRGGVLGREVTLILRDLVDALAAQPVLVLDPEKVAEVLRGHILGDPYGGTASGAACDCSCGAESYSGDGSRSHARNLAQKHQARALCEAAKRGELS